MCLGAYPLLLLLGPLTLPPYEKARASLLIGKRPSGTAEATIDQQV